MTYRFILLISIFFLVLTACSGSGVQATAEDKGLEASGTSTPAQATQTPPAPVEQPPVEGPAYSPLDPLPDEEKMIRGSISVGTSEIIMMESFPVQVTLNVSGMLPTPCNMPRAEVTEPEENNTIYVEMWTLVEPDAVCIQVLQPFEVSIPLGSYESGTYTVILNDQEVGEFSL
jgi:hypothetical protein